MSRSAENHAVFDDLLLHQRNNPSSTRAQHGSLLLALASSRRSGPHSPLHTRLFAPSRCGAPYPRVRRGGAIFASFYYSDLSHTRHTRSSLLHACLYVHVCAYHTRGAKKACTPDRYRSSNPACLEEQVSGAHLLCRLCTAHAPKRAVFASFVGQGRACLSTKWSLGSMKRLRA